MDICHSLGYGSFVSYPIMQASFSSSVWYQQYLALNKRTDCQNEVAQYDLLRLGSFDCATHPLRKERGVSSAAVTNCHILSPMRASEASFSTSERLRFTLIRKLTAGNVSVAAIPGGSNHPQSRHGLDMSLLSESAARHLSPFIQEGH